MMSSIFPEELQYEFIPWRIADERPAFGHSAADKERELDFVEKSFHLFVHGCTTDDDFKPPSQGIDEFFRIWP